MQYLSQLQYYFDFTPIDCTTNKEHTLTNESKERIKDKQGPINIYFVGYTEDDTTYTLAKQYNKVNDNINVEIIDIKQRTDLASEYELTADSNAIVVTCGDKSKILNADDLYTYGEDYNTIDLSEEKITSAILNVTSEKVPKAYFLTGYSDYNMEATGGMSYLSMLLEDEVLEFENLDLLIKGSVPEDCDTLIITTPSKDFDDLTANEIIKYINNGGDILWLNASYAEKLDLKNVNKVLALYGVDPFDEGYIYETDTEKIAFRYAGCLVEGLGNTDIDKNLTTAIFLNPTKVNIDSEKATDLGVEQQLIVSSGETSYFRKDVSNTSSSTDGDEKGDYTIGAILTRPLEQEDGEDEEDDEVEVDEDSEDIEDIEEDSETDEEAPASKLVIFGDNNFISDIQIVSQIGPMVGLYNNKDLVLNSIAYLSDQDEGITIRKAQSSQSSFTATDGQKAIIMRIIFTVPIAVILLGIVVWQIRRRKK